MKLFKLIPLAIIAIFFTACNEEAQTVVKETPSFEEIKTIKSQNKYTLKTTEGKEISLDYDNQILTSKELNGKITLINFFATWCPPCKEEIPIFNELIEKYPDDFQIISILFQDPIEMEKLKEFIDKYKINFPITVGKEENERLAKNMNNVQKIPESYLFTKDGVLIEKYFGAVNEKSINKTLNKLINGE